MTARKAKAKAAMLTLFSETSPDALPIASSTSDSSLSWLRLIAGTRLMRWPWRILKSAGKTVTRRLATSTAPKTSIQNK